MIAEIKSMTSYRYCEKTLQNAIHCVGVGLHHGQKTKLTLKPAPAGHGITFHRTDITDKNNVIPAKFDSVVDTRLCSCLGNKDGVIVSTAEHLMAALSGMGITNAMIDLDGPEIPIMDGSAADFITLIECAGIMDQDAPLRAIRILKDVTHTDGIAQAYLSPQQEGFSLDYVLDYSKWKTIGRQEYSFTLTPRTFKDAMSYARTFCLAADIEKMQAAGLIKGGSLENAIVVSQEDTILNPEGLRSENEFVIHKALDAVGDLYLFGMPVIGRFEGYASGHKDTNALMRAVMADPSAYEIVDMNKYMESLLQKHRQAV